MRLLQMSQVKMKDKYKELGCEFKNEAECEEEADDEKLDLKDIEEEHYDEEDDIIEEKITK